VLQLKANHPKFYAALLARHLAEPPPGGYHTVCERRSGHVYSWQSRVLDVTEMPQQPAWAGLARAVVVVKTDTYRGETSEHTHVYLTSLCTTPLPELAAGIRGHWGIENQLHRTRDVHFRQDTNCIRQRVAATNLALLNTLALNFLLPHVDRSVCDAQCWLNHNFKQWLDEKRI
jgi:predicted transposase YbfD/YdcC